MSLASHRSLSAPALGLHKSAGKSPVRSLLLCALFASAGTAAPGSAWATGNAMPASSFERSHLATSEVARLQPRRVKDLPAPRTLAKKPGKRKSDPFEPGSDASGGASRAQARKGKAADDSAARADGAGAARESNAKSGGSGSGASLDSLMAGVVSEEKAKGKARDNREMDAILKDVQKKNEPAPVVKKEEPTTAPPLSPAEIGAAMSQLRARGNSCAQRLGRGGTAELKITVSKDGKVTDVRMGGKLAGTPVGSCVEQAARAITFRRNAGLRFDYRIEVR
jgi:hypothetical protein